MTSYAIDAFAMAHVFEDATLPKVHVSARSRRRLTSLAIIGFVIAVAALHLGTAILHPSAATSSEFGVAIVGP